MEESVAEAARAAVAMEKLATNSETSMNAGKKMASQQMRAYLTVVFGGATYQEKSKNYFFGGMPKVVNSGHTPAHKVRYRAKADILPVPLPYQFDFPLPSEVTGGSMVGPNQSSDLQSRVDYFVPDEEVAEIKLGLRRAVYIWGVINYEDAFEQPRETKFCQSFFWFKGEDDKEICRCYYTPRHNEAN